MRLAYGRVRGIKWLLPLDAPKLSLRWWLRIVDTLHLRTRAARIGNVLWIHGCGVPRQFLSNKWLPKCESTVDSWIWKRWTILGNGFQVRDGNPFTRPALLWSVNSPDAVPHHRVVIKKVDEWSKASLPVLRQWEDKLWPLTARQSLRQTLLNYPFRLVSGSGLLRVW
jgi:hypothetical protein